MSHATTLLVFVIAALITWFAGVWLTRSTDAIDNKHNLGSTFGGLLILGVITSLPEAAVTVTAARQHHYDVVVGTLIGGIAIQTVVLSILDAKMKLKEPLTFAAASLSLVLEACLVIVVTAAAMIAARTPIVLPHTHISFASVLIFALWTSGLWLVYKARNGLPWRAEALKGAPGREYHERRLVINHPTLKRASMSKIYVVLILSSLATVVAGYALATTGSQLATEYNIGSGLFAATFIALAGALPNISTGIASIRLNDYKLAMSDIFGGNAFMPALFILADAFAGKAVIQSTNASDIWFAAMGILLTAVYIVGLIFRPRRQFLGMGLDSIFVIIFYIAGVAVLARSGG
jgi:cation:H+ antiporter